MLRVRALVVLIAATAPLLAGAEWMLDFGNPSLVKDPAATGALTTVRILNKDGQVQDWPLTGTAEGLVNGQRVSAPLEIIKLPAAGLRVVKWRRPGEGVWVLSLRVDDRAYYEKNGRDVLPLRGAVTAVLPDGVAAQARLLPHPPTSKEIDDALSQLAGRAMIGH